MYYDISTGERRIATQQDIDRMNAIVQSYGRLRSLVKQMEQEHVSLTSWIKEYCS